MKDWVFTNMTMKMLWVILIIKTSNKYKGYSNLIFGLLITELNDQDRNE